MTSSMVEKFSNSGVPKILRLYYLIFIEVKFIAERSGVR